MSNPALGAGPARDGSKSLAKESKAGLAVSFILAIAATAILGALNTLDVTTLPGWAQAAGVLAISHVSGLLTAYLKANR